MAPAAVPDTLPCDTASVFTRELKDAKDVLELDETEESWEKIQRSVCRLHALYKGGGYQFEADVVPGLKLLARPIVNAMNSDRSRLSFEAVDFVASLASLGRAFDPLLHHFFEALLRLCTRTSKVLIARAQAAVLRIVEETTLPGVLPHLRDAVKDKSQSLRTAASVAALQALNTFAPRDLAIKVADVEDIIRSTGRDANPAVRQTSRKIFEAYQILFPERVDGFTAPLSPTMKKYLAVKPRTIVTSRPAVPVPAPPTSAPSTAVTFPSEHVAGHARSASASEHQAAARREAVAHAAPPALRSQRSRPAMRAEMPPPPAPAPAPQPMPTSSHAAQFQPTRSAPSGAQRARAVSTLSAKSVQAALGVVAAAERPRLGPQRVLTESQTRPPPPERVVSGPARVQRPATALGTVSTSELSDGAAPAPVVVHRAQRVLLPPPPPPAPKETKLERVTSREKEQHDAHAPRSHPPTRPGSAASVASRTKPAPASKTVPATKTAPATKTMPASKPGPSKAMPCVMPKRPEPAQAAQTTASKPAAKPATDPDAAARIGFVPRRNGGATGMTAAALARATELREARERAAATTSKPVWGRAPNKNAKVAAVLAKKAAKRPVEVPLPPSPGAPPREVPLPESPASVAHEVPNDAIEELVLDAEKENVPAAEDKENVPAGSAEAKLSELAAQVEALERMVLGQVNAP